jgi:hypothetical protein
VAVTERPDATRCGAGVAQGEGGRIVEAEKYANGGPPRGHDFSKCDRTDRRNAGGSAIPASRPPGQLLHRLPEAATEQRRGEDFPTVQNAQARCGVKGENQTS